MSLATEEARAVEWRAARERRKVFVAMLKVRLTGSEVAKAETVAGWQAVLHYQKERNRNERQDSQGNVQVVNS